LIIDIEIVRRSQRLSRGIDCDEEKWLDAVIAQVKPGNNFLTQPSTKKALRAGELYLSHFGLHDTYEHWEALGRPDLLAQARSQIAEILSTYQPMPLDEAAERELDRLENRAREPLASHLAASPGG